MTIAMIDGRAENRHAALQGAAIDILPMGTWAADIEHRARAHATLVASILVGRHPETLGLCSNSRLLNLAALSPAMLSRTAPAGVVAAQLARAVTAAVRGGADVILLGFDVRPTSDTAIAVLLEAIVAAAERGVRTVAPIGNRPGFAGSPLARSAGVVPVGMAGHDGTPDPQGSWDTAVAQRGLLAPGRDVPGAHPAGGVVAGSGSSYAAALVAGAFALLLSLTPARNRDAAWEALLATPQPGLRRRLFPPPLDADASARALMTTRSGGASDGRR